MSRGKDLSFDRVIDRSERVAQQSGQDLGEELRRQAESLAYKAAKDYELALRRIERELVAATDKDNRFSEGARSVALDVVRTHMVRGLMRAQIEAGTSMTFWARR